MCRLVYNINNLILFIPDLFFVSILCRTKMSMSTRTIVLKPLVFVIFLIAHLAGPAMLSSNESICSLVEFFQELMQQS